jgi:tetratricopeptide (TPR) repeat protein
MKKQFIFASLLILILPLMAMASENQIIDRNELSLKAGPTDPGEELSMVWLESYVYPKNVNNNDPVISLGVRTTSKVESVEAAFDFTENTIALTSHDGLNWTGAFMVPGETSSGLHVVKYAISGSKGRVRRTVEFFVDSGRGFAQQKKGVSFGEAVQAKSWPLTVTADTAALANGSSRKLYAGQKLIGLYKTPWYKVIFEDGKEGWVSASVVEEPLDKYYKLGYEAYQNKKYSLAIDYYKDAIAIDPSFIKGYLWLAKSYFNNEDLELAYQTIVEAFRRDARDLNCRLFAAKLSNRFFEIAHGKFKKGRYNEAILQYQKVLELKPNSAVSLIEIGKCYEKLNIPAEARAAWRRALSVDPQNQEVYALLNITPDSIAISGVAPEGDGATGGVVEVADDKVPPALVDDTLEAVRESQTKKGTKVSLALRSVITMTKSLGTPVIEKGWQIVKKGDKFLVRYLCEQGAGAIEPFDWLVDVDTRRISANNDNARLLMERW